LLNSIYILHILFESMNICKHDFQGIFQPSGEILS